MPCRHELNTESYFNKNKIQDMEKELALTKAVLCGIMTYIDLYGNHQEIFPNDILLYLNYEEMGVSKQELANWWDNHKKEDKIRKETIKQKALAKLTPEERKFLGFD